MVMNDWQYLRSELATISGISQLTAIAIQFVLCTISTANIKYLKKDWSCIENVMQIILSNELNQIELDYVLKK